MAMYIFGHKIPDSDSIISAIAMSYLQNKLGVESIPTRQGDINPETAYILEKFDLEAPVLKTSYAGEEVYLTDFSDIAQAPDDISEATIVGIVDHHKLGDLTTSTPLECWIRPVGCTNTIVKEMFEYYDIEIPKNIAGAMMCAILSDTVIFKSPTCTKLDTKITKELASICEIEDFKAIGLEMFKVKSAVEGVEPRELVMRDYKEFSMNGAKVGIGQLEVVDLSIFDGIKGDLQADIEKLKEEKGLDTVLLLLTDIIAMGSEVLVSSNSSDKIEKAFDIKIEDSKFYLKGCLSRKKQIVPFLEPAFS
ncbi:MAG: manganese-dependent inorganic pyrophosphatase [Campylobacterota bacterium]|nr:manganese-dependent inorganic pyrophosphatase [Campylobacterota bacterium]